jgi:small subunit ribosomal protein S16
VGFYNPHTDPPEIRIDLEKVDQWRSQGAGVSETVESLIRKAKHQSQA